MFSYRCGIKQIRFGSTPESLTKIFNLPECNFTDPYRHPSDAKDWALIDKDLDLVFAVIDFQDGSQSDVQQIVMKEIVIE